MGSDLRVSYFHMVSVHCDEDVSGQEAHGGIRSFVRSAAETRGQIDW